MMKGRETMTYKKKIEITQEELNYYNELLGLDLYDKHDMERLGAKQNDYISIRTIDFDNGNYVTIDLASGDSNYFDNIVLYDKSGNELMCSDCTYELSSFSLYYDNDIYDIEMVVE